MSKIVSIILTAYNEEEFIEDSILSLLRQTHKNIEVIAVNDGSSDKTFEYLEKIKKTDSRLIAIDLKRNVGKATAQNIGYESASGDFIAIASGDDFYAADRIEKQLKFLERGKHDFVFSNLYLYHSSRHGGNSLSTYYKRPFALKHGLTEALAGQSFPCGSALFSRKLANLIYPIPPSLSYEDRWISAIATIQGKIGYLDEPLVYYRQHSNNSWNAKADENTLKTYLENKSKLRERDISVLKELRQRYYNSGFWNSKTDVIYETSMKICTGANQYPSIMFFQTALCCSKLRGRLSLQILLGTMTCDFAQWAFIRLSAMIKSLR